MNRREFILTSAVSAAASTLSGAAAAAQAVDKQKLVYLYGDGLLLSPLEHMNVLQELMAQGTVERDFYCRGGVVAALEQRMAALLGKEAGMFFPTGTMANHLALRTLAGEERRILVSRESHTYNDEEDGPQLISGLAMVPLGSGRATFTLQEVQAEIQHLAGGYRKVPIGVIAIESPVRRRDGALFDFEEMKKISAFAQTNKIRMHLDGARLLLAPPYSKVAPAQYAALFDTVYVSLYKYLGAPFGAVLCGPKKLLDSMRPVRQSLGGAVFGAWPAACIALKTLEGFSERFASAVALSEEFLRRIAADRRVRVERIASGTNIARLRLAGIDGAKLAQRLEAEGVRIQRPEDGVLEVQTNESLLRSSAERLAQTFLRALG